jgi:hypothetical protein
LPRGAYSVRWEKSELELEVWFDSNGRVLKTPLLVFIESPNDPVEATVFRAKRQWHRWFP